LIQQVSGKNRRIGLIAAVIAIAIIGFIALKLRPKPQPELECYTDQTRTMTIQEVATLLDTPLVELNWLPQDLKITPVVSSSPTYAIGYPEYSRCDVTIEYPRPGTTSRDNLIYIGIIHPYEAIQSTKTPPRCSWQFSPNGPLGTNCSIDIDGSKSTISISFSMSDDLPPEDALKILDGMRVVEPQE
jgi:hypothetical protein